MADTVRTLAQLQTLLADNASGDISPQDLRDLLVSLSGGIGHVWQSGNATATVFADTATYTKGLVSGTALVAGGRLFDSPVTGRLRYIGAADALVQVTAVVVLSASVPVEEIRARLAKNGATVASSEVKGVSVSGNFLVLSLTAMVAVVQNDYLEVWLRNATDTDDVTVDTLSIVGRSVIA